MSGVYFLRVGRYVKVGYSENPERRMARIFRSSSRYSRPYDMSLTDEREPLAVIAGDEDTERACHAALADFAAGCEWFIDESGVRAFISAAQEGVFDRVTRPGGPFVRTWTPTPEREAELARLIERRKSA